MKTKAEISKITITVAGQKLELTLEEARDLKKALNDALEPKTVFPYVPPVVIDRPVYVPPPPYPWDRWNTSPYRPRPGEIWCGSGSNNVGELTGELTWRSDALQITG